MTLSLGQTLVTAGLHQYCQQSDSLRRFCHESLSRHKKGDWGDCDPNDWDLNDQAAACEEGRIISVYEFPLHLTSRIQLPDTRLWIITYPNAHTTLLFPHEY